jgi:hypothetical protein
MDNEEIESFMRIQGLVIREMVLVKQQSLELRDHCALNLRLDDFPHTGAQNYGAIQIAIHSYSR